MEIVLNLWKCLFLCPSHRLCSWNGTQASFFFCLPSSLFFFAFCPDLIEHVCWSEPKDKTVFLEISWMYLFALNRQSFWTNAFIFFYFNPSISLKQIWLNSINSGLIVTCSGLPILYRVQLCQRQCRTAALIHSRSCKRLLLEDGTWGPISRAVKAIIIHRRPRSGVSRPWEPFSRGGRLPLLFSLQFAAGRVRFTPLFFFLNILGASEKTPVDTQRGFTNRSVLGKCD